MLAQLVRKFQCILILHPAVSTANVKLRLANNNCLQQYKRNIFHLEKSADSTERLNSIEADADYVVPYRPEQERYVKYNVILEALSKRFRLNSNDIKRVMSENVVNSARREHSLVDSMEILCLDGVTKRSFVENPWLLAIDSTRLRKKLELLRTLPLRDINDFVPLMRLSVPRLKKLVERLNREGPKIPEGNRIYYVSAKLKLSASIVSQYLSKRLFVLEIPFQMLEQNLNNMIDYKVSSMDILRDLWAFRYTPISVKTRLERAKIAKKPKIMPWMVRCPEPILQKSLKLSLDELKVLGEHKSAIEYLAHRLEFSVEETKSIMARHPQVFTVRVTKIKEVLDYLLNEAGFTRHEIAQVPRILCHSLETTKERLQELKSYGCRPSTLVIVCRSKREYDKFVKAWLNSSRMLNHGTQQEITK